MPVNDIHHQRTGRIIHYCCDIQVRNVLEYLIAVPFTAAVHIEGSATAVIGIEIERLEQRIPEIAIRGIAHKARQHGDIGHFHDVGMPDKGVQMLSQHQ